jgi:chromate reductase
MADQPSLNVLGFAGSLRKGSFNRMLLRAAVELAPPGMTIDTYELDAIPLYNGDVEAQGDPAPVGDFKDAIGRADAILVVTPEYNYGIPGVLKNAIDWASRPPGRSVLNGKPAAIMGATPGAFGTTRAQLQLRQAFLFTQTLALLQPEVLVAKAHEKFDGEGRLADETTRKFVRQLLEALPAWVARVRPA